MAEEMKIDVTDVIAAYERRLAASLKELAMQEAVITTLQKQLKASNETHNLSDSRRE